MFGIVDMNDFSDLSRMSNIGQLWVDHACNNTCVRIGDPHTTQSEKVTKYIHQNIVSNVVQTETLCG